MRRLVTLALCFAFVSVVLSQLSGTIYYRDTVACSGNYSIANRSCTGSDGTSFTSIASARAVMVAGDTLQYRAGTYNEQLSNGSLNGTASARITFEAFPGESVTLSYTGASYPMTLNGNYITYSGLTINAIGATGRLSNFVSGNNYIIQNMTISDNWGAGLLVSGGSNITIRNNIIRRSGVAGNCVPGQSSITYGIYLHHTSGTGGVLIEGNELDSNTGAGIHAYPGPNKGVVFRKNSVHDNNFCTASVGGGVIFFIDSTGGNMESPQVYDNVIYNNGRSHPVHGGPGGNADGIRMSAGAGFTISNPLIANNTIYGHTRLASSSAIANGIQMDLSITGARLVNNLLYNNQDQDITTNGGITTNAFNACTAARSCGTSKVTIANITDCVISTSDFRLKTGANTCRNAGTTVASRPAPVGVPDVGAYEQGMVASATVAGGFIEVTMNVMTPSVLPASGITGVTIANGTSTGTPVASVVGVKAGTDNVVLVTTSGFTGAGSCTLSVSTTNMTDSGYVGTTTTGTAQGVNTVTGQAVTGTCNNSAGGAPPGTLHVHHKMNEGAGTSLNDETANNLDSTTSGTPTWTTPVVEGAGLYFPNDGVDRRVDMAYGNAVNATSQSFTFCVWVKPDAGVTGKLAMGTPNGTNMRMAIGWYTTTWGIGVGSSSYSSAASEFPVTPTLTRVCLINDATTDTAKLAVNGVIGTSAAAVKSSASVTSLAGNFKIGCGILSTAYCGGFTVDEPKIWLAALTPTEILEDYNSYTPAGGSEACYKQQDTQQQGVYLTPAGAVENRGSAGGSFNVVAGGGMAVVFQVDCTGSAGAAVALKARYSRNGGAYSLNVPQTLGADGIAMWGENTSSGLNGAVVGDCISGALTENYGPTVTDALALPTITLAQNHSFCVRYIFKVGADQAGSTFDFRLYQDNGQPLANGYTVTPRATVIAPQASAGP